MARPRSIHAFVSLALLIAGTTTIWLLFMRPPVPEWRVRLLDQPIMGVETSGGVSGDYSDRLLYLSGDLGRRVYWGEDEVREVLSLLRGSPIDLVPIDGVTSQEDTEAYFLSFFTQGFVRTRLGIGAPIEPYQRLRLIDALLERSYAAAPLVREGLAEAFCWSGLIFEDERVDKRVHEMMNDPEPRVAANARSQYKFHSDGREKWAEYQRRQGRDIPPEDG